MDFFHHPLLLICVRTDCQQFVNNKQITIVYVKLTIWQTRSIDGFIMRFREALWHTYVQNKFIETTLNWREEEKNRVLVARNWFTWRCVLFFCVFFSLCNEMVMMMTVMEMCARLCHNTSAICQTVYQLSFHSVLWFSIGFIFFSLHLQHLALTTHVTFHLNKLFLNFKWSFSFHFRWMFR